VLHLITGTNYLRVLTENRSKLLRLVDFSRASSVEVCSSTSWPRGPRGGGGMGTYFPASFISQFPCFYYLLSLLPCLCTSLHPLFWLSTFWFNPLPSATHCFMPAFILFLLTFLHIEDDAKVTTHLKLRCIWICEISGSYGGEYEDNCLPGCCAVESGSLPLFQRWLLPHHQGDECTVRYILIIKK
jgi:hypothetical protein